MHLPCHCHFFFIIHHAHVCSNIFFFLIKVHIPCPSERQWILIVANFIDKSFDVLNPDHSDEKFKPIVTTVTNNFKNLFIKSYPGCTYFNIRDFEVRYVKTPQHNFRYSYYTTFFNFNFLQYNIFSLFYMSMHVHVLRYKFLIMNMSAQSMSSLFIFFMCSSRYDSGIFVMQFIRWYNGIEVQHFSNVRIFIWNPIRLPITTFFHN